MLELYVMMTLLGLGSWIQHNSHPQSIGTDTKSNDQTTKSKNEEPSMNNIYDSTFVDKARSIEYDSAKKTYSDSLKPGGGTVNRVRFSELTGTDVDMSHANMVPFFRGSLKEVNADRQNGQTLENYTGTPVNYYPKKESTAFFPPSMDNAYTTGAPVQIDKMLDHIVPPYAQNNFFPIPSVCVGPGLNQGYTSSPSGGFQQPDTNKYATAPTIDQLRMGSQQQSTHTIEPKIGMKEIKMSTEPPLVSKHRVETSYEKSPDSWFVTTGSRVMETMRSAIAPIKRFTPSIEYFGSLGPTASTAMPIRSEIRKSTRVMFPEIDPRKYNTISTNVKGTAFDRGTRLWLKSRSLSGNIVTNLTKLVKNMISTSSDPITNQRRHLKRSLKNPRPEGELQSTCPPRGIVRNNRTRESSAKQTVKQTTLNPVPWMNIVSYLRRPKSRNSKNLAKVTGKQTTSGRWGRSNITSFKQGTMKSSDLPKPTLRQLTQSTPVSNTTAHLRGTLKSPSSLKHTLKQTLIQPTIISNIATSTKRGLVSASNIPKQTMKQTLNKPTILTNISNFVQGTIYPNEVPKMTAKQTLHRPTEIANIAPHTRGTVYLDDKPQSTMKQTVTRPSVVNNVSTFIKGAVYVDDEQTTTMKETLQNNDVSNFSSHNRALVYSVEEPPITIKDTNISPVDQTNLAMGSRGTLNTADQPRITQKQTMDHSSDTLNLAATNRGLVYGNDVAKTTIKQTVQQPAENTNLSTYNRGTLPTTEPAKITLKQTVNQGSDAMNMSSYNRGTVQLNDDAKMTVKETLCQPSETTNIKTSTLRGTVYTDDAPIATSKQSLLQPSALTNASGMSAPTLNSTEKLESTLKDSVVQPSETLNLASFLKRTIYGQDKAKPTLKEQGITVPTANVITNPRNQVYTVDSPNVTIKEQTIQDTLPHTVITGDVQSYVFDDNEIAKATTRNTLAQSEDLVNLRGGQSHTVYDPNDRPSTTQKESVESMGRVHGNIDGCERTNAAYMNEVFLIKPTNKESTCDNSYYGQANKNNADAYLVSQMKAKPTNKESTSDVSYYGTASATDQVARNQMSYESANNAILNETKQKLETIREPTLSGPKSFNHDIGGVKSHKGLNAQTRETNNIDVVNGNKLGAIIQAGVTTTKHEYENTLADEGIIEDLIGNDMAIMNAYKLRQKIMR